MTLRWLDALILACFIGVFALAEKLPKSYVRGNFETTCQNPKDDIDAGTCEEWKRRRK